MASALYHPQLLAELKKLLRESHHPDYSPELLRIPKILENTKDVTRRLIIDISNLETNLERQLGPTVADTIRLEELKKQYTLNVEITHISQSLLAPIRRLHSDILRLVFEAVCDNFIFVYISDMRYKGVAETNAIPALNLGRVSRYWRELSIDHPQLWSKLDIELVTSKSRDEADRLLLDLLLARSKSHPLSIYMLPYETDVEVETSIRTYAWKRILKERHRFRSLSYHSGYWLPIIGLQGAFPLLEELNVSFNEDEDEELTSQIFALTPKLTNLTLSQKESLSFNFGWSQLLTLRLWGCGDSAEAYSVINQCSQLQSLTMHLGGRPLEETFPWRSPIRKLVLSGSTETMSAFLKLGVAPGLERLELQNDAGTRSGDSESNSELGLSSEIQSFCSRSECKITSLVILRWIESEDLISLLRVLPSLTEFFLAERDSLVNAIVTSMIPGIGVNPPTLAHLEKLSFYLLESVDVDAVENGAEITPFTAFLLSRCNSPLKDVYIKLGKHTFEPDAFRPLLSGEMKIVVISAEGTVICCRVDRLEAQPHPPVYIPTQTWAKLFSWLGTLWPFTYIASISRKLGTLATISRSVWSFK